MLFANMEDDRIMRIFFMRFSYLTLELDMAMACDERLAADDSELLAGGLRVLASRARFTCSDR